MAGSYSSADYQNHRRTDTEDRLETFVSYSPHSFVRSSNAAMHMRKREPGMRKMYSEKLVL
jgi:hypothetical protein